MSTVPSTRHSLVGKTIDNQYRIERLIAEGGFGVVFEARQPLGDGSRKVALKCLKPKSARDQEAIKRFQREAGAAGRLTNPYVCKVFVSGKDENEGLYYLVMEFAEGKSLQDRVAPGQLAEADAARWMRQAATGLLAAERNQDEQGRAQPIFHRDLKPANLLLDKDGNVLVADFGSAKLGNEVGLTGDTIPTTVAFASPEFAREADDVRNDIYALGATFYYLLTGQFPTDKDRRAQNPKRSRPELSDRLCRVIARMTEPSRARRYSSFREVVDDLQPLVPGRLPKLVVAALGLVAVVGTAVSAETAGAIDVVPWLGPVRVVVDVSQPSLAELQAAYKQLLSDNESDPATPPGAPAANAVAWRELVAKSLERVREYIADPSYGPDLRLAPATRRDMDLASREELERALREAKAEDAIAALEALLEPTASGRELRVPVAKAIGEYNRVREEHAGALRDAPSLDERLQAVRSAIDDVAERRRGAVQGLRDAFVKGSVDVLGELRRQAEQRGEEMAKVGETELANDCAGLAAAIAEAQKVELPAWDPREEDLDTNEKRLAALRQLVSTDERVIQGGPTGSAEQTLADWWQRRKQELGQAWAPRAAEMVRQLVEATNEQVARMNSAIRRRSASKDEYKVVETAVNGCEEILRDLDRAARNEGALDDELVLEKVLDELVVKRLDEFSIELVTNLSAYETLQREAEDARAALRDLSDVEKDVLAPAKEGVERAAKAIDDAVRVLKENRGNPRVEVAPLVGLRSEFERAKSLLVAARQGLATIEQLQDELKALPAKDAEERLQQLKPDVLELCPELRERRTKIYKEIARVRKVREDGLEELRQRFRDGNADLVALDGDIVSWLNTLPAKDDLRDAGESLRRSLAGAQALRDQVPQWPPDGADPFAAFEDLEAALKAVAGAAAGGEDPELSRWWGAYRGSVGRKWADATEALLRQLEPFRQRLAEHNAAVDDGKTMAEIGESAYDELRKDYDKYDKLISRLWNLRVTDPLPGAFAVAVSAAAVSEPKRPPSGNARASIPAEVRDEWPVGYDFETPARLGLKWRKVNAEDEVYRRLYPNGFLGEGESKTLWYFKGRVGAGKEPVYMVLVKCKPSPLLVDVHEVTLGEMFGAGLGSTSDWGNYWRYGSEQINPIDDSRKPSTLAFYTSAEVGKQFASRAYSQRFALPTRAELEQLLATAPGAVAPELSQPPTVGDVIAAGPSADGLLGLGSGLAEWCMEGEALGRTTYRRGERVVSYFFDTGFRLVYRLEQAR